MIWRIRPGSGADHERHVGRRNRRRARVPWRRPEIRSHRGRLIEKIADVEVDRFELEPIRLDLRQIEHIVDQRQQRACAAADEIERYSRCVSSSGRLGENVRHADHAVHRRADLMAHVREKAALGAARGLGRKLGIQDRLFGELALGDQVDGACEEQRIAGGVALGLAARRRTHS